MKHDAAAVGLWSYSRDEEQWSGQEFFDTREEAVAAGAAETGDPSFYVGRVRWVASGASAARYVVCDFDDADCAMCESEDVACDDRLLHEPSSEQRAELHALVASWLDRHGLVGNWFQVESVERVAAEEPQ